MTKNPSLDSVIEQTWPILLDFDGPVTHLFIDGRNRMVADRMRAAMPSGVSLPEALRDTHDPLIILRWAAQHLDRSALLQIESACVVGESLAAADAVPTPGTPELLSACFQVGRPVIVVSNNAEEAITHFLDRQNLLRMITGIVGRIPGRPELMKPDPTSVCRALSRLEAEASRSAMIGDSATDIEVCKATGVRSIGFAKNPRRGQELHDAGADAIVSNLLEIAQHPCLGSGARPAV